MRRLAIASLIVMILSFVGPVVAAGKITIDPNASGVNVEKPAASDTDERLDQKLTYSAKNKSVLTILTDLTKMTGVKLIAGSSAQDWQTRDRKMNIFVKDIPLRNLMDSIAHVMKFMWHRSDASGVWTYRLYMDRNTLLGVERQRLREEERLIKLEYEQRDRLADEFNEAAAMSDADLEKIKDNNPYLYINAKIGWTTLLSAVFSQVPEARKAWSAGEYIALNVSDLPADAQQAALKALDVMGGTLGKMGYTIPPDASKDLSKLRIDINHTRKYTGYRGDMFIGDVTFNWYNSGNNSGFVNPDSELAKTTARDYIKIIDGQPINEEQQNELNDGHIQTIREQKTDFGEPLIEHEDDPALDVKVKLKIEDGSFEELLEVFAKASDFSIVSDSFYMDYRNPWSKEQEVMLKDILEKTCLPNRYNWQKQGSVIEFRHRDWFRKRAAQIPDAWIEPWRKSLIETGVLDLDQLCQAAALDDDQVRENIYTDEILYTSRLDSVIFFCSDTLKAYGCLSKAQQNAIFNGGLDLGLISPSQWNTMSRMFRSYPMFTSNPDASIKLTGKREMKGKQIKYTLTAMSSADVPPVKLAIPTPVYEPPKKQEPLSLTPVSVTRNSMSISVDPRIELLSIVQYLSDYKTKFPDLVTKTNTAYRKEVDDWFSKFADHAVVKMFNSMSAKSFSYDAPPHVVLYLNADLSLDQVIFEDYKSGVTRAGGKDQVAAFTSALQAFAVESNFSGFFNSHTDFYKKIIEETFNNAQHKDSIETIEQYYGEKRGRYIAVLVPLANGNFGAQVERKKGMQEIYCIMGCYQEKDGVPLFVSNEYYQRHEFGHSFVNPLTDKYWNTCERYSGLYAPMKPTMIKMAYGDWKCTINESIIRAITTRLAYRLDGQEAGDTELKCRKSEGFIFTDALVEKLKEYEQNRSKYPTLDSFYPELLKVFDGFTESSVAEMLKHCGDSGNSGNN